MRNSNTVSRKFIRLFLLYTHRNLHDFVSLIYYCLNLLFCFSLHNPISALQKVDDIILEYSSLPACTFQFLQIDFVLLCQ